MSGTSKTKNFLSRAGTGLLKKLWIFFAGLWAIQLGLLYVSVSDVRVPDALVEKILKEAEREGLRCSVEDMRLHNLTVITAREIYAVTLHGNEPLVRIRQGSLKLEPSGLISGNPIPQRICIDGAELFCPSVNSSTGQSERVLFDGALSVVRKDDGEIRLNSLKFRLADATFAAYGTLPFPQASSDGYDAPENEKLSPGNAVPEHEKISAILARAAKILSEALRNPNLKPLLEGGELVAVADVDSAGNLNAELSAFLPELRFGENIAFEKVAAKQAISADFANAKISPCGEFYGFAENANFSFGEFFSEKICGRAERLAFATHLPEDIFSFDAASEACLPKKVFARAEQLRAVSLLHGAANLRCILLAVEPVSAWEFPGVLRVRANVSSGNSSAAVAGTFLADVDAPSLDFNYEIFADKEDLNAFPQLRFVTKQKDFRALRFTELPNLRGNVRFASGMKFDGADFEISSGEMFCGNVHLRGLDAAGAVKPDSISVPKICAEGLDFTANGDFFTEFSRAGDFRVRAWGSINPEYLDDRLGWFWERIWRDLKTAPSDRQPRADIDVYGNWSDRWEHVFGAIAGEDCFANGVLVDKVRLRVYEDPLLIAAFDMGFERGKDLVEGNLQWHYAMAPDYHYRDFRFLFNGSIPPKDVLQIIGEGLPEALSELKTDGAGTAVVSGFFSGDPRYYADRMLVNVSGEVPGAFSIFGIEGENFKGEIFYDNGTVFVGNPFFADVGEGTVTGAVRVELPEDGHGAEGSKVALSLDLKNVRRSRLASVLEAVAAHVEDAPETGISENADSEVVATAEPEAKVDTSLIDATFAGTLTVPNLHSLKASGTFFLTEEDLFRLQIFGGFSRLLSTIKIDLTTFPMSYAEGSFTVSDGTIFLPDARVFGESGEINIRANIELDDLKIRGEAIFRNLRGTRIPILGKLVEWGSASTELLPVSIGGTLDNLEWKIEPTISRIWSKPKDGFGTAPAAPATEK